MNEVKKSLELDGPKIRKWTKWPVLLQWTVQFEKRSLLASGPSIFESLVPERILDLDFFIFDLSLFVFLFILFLTGEN